MKTKLHCSAGSFVALALWLFANVSVSSAFAQGTAFTYQGQLSSGTNLATGTYDLTFSLYNVSSGGSSVFGPVTTTAVGVTNGLFTVVVDFGAGVFTGSSYWLGIGVRTNGSGVFNPLAPRQPLTPAPYAIFAEGANAAGLTGAVLSGHLPADVALTDATQTFTADNSFSGNLFLLDPTKTILFPATSGANSPMMAMFSSGTDNADRMVIAHSPAFPNWGLQYQDSSDKFNFLSAGIPILTINLGADQIYAIGSVGIGTAGAPQQFLSVQGGVNIDQAGANAGFLDNGFATGYGLSFGSDSGEGVASERQPGGGNQYGLDFYTDFGKRMLITQTGEVWVSNVLTVAGSEVAIVGGNAYDGNGAIDAYIGGTGAGSDVMIGSYNPLITAIGFWNSAANAYMHIYCSSITINGGSDLAEPFKMSAGNEEIPQGAVVVIDEQNPGHLKLSDQGYDTHVAGVVSGANGINPGIQMQQQGVLEGGKNVALSGRVYVQADASNGAIKPGDLLTTSTAPGYAMKVTDHARAAGAILGKAMTGLSEGQGMVLVLVTLQ